jgi:uncharacterized radical SAM superfamily Fe-S cluster-containing enzyme
MNTKQAISLRREAGVGGIADRQRADSDYVFHELTRSICPACRLVIDAKILLRDNKVYMSKRCPRCGPFMSLVYGDAEAYVSPPNSANSMSFDGCGNVLSRPSRDSTDTRCRHPAVHPADALRSCRLIADIVRILQL